MYKNIAVKTVAQSKGLIGAHSARRRFVPAQREPLNLPEEKVEIPAPQTAPPPPPAPNLISSILPPVLMLVGVLIGALINTSSLWAMIPMFLMSLGFPAANLLSLESQKKSYQKGMEKRELNYRQRLSEARQYLDKLSAVQRQSLEGIYPDLSEVIKIALTHGKLLWSCRPMDDDFLSLRLGSGAGKSSFSLEVPRYANPDDKLVNLSSEIYQEYRMITDLPMLIPLGKVGSVAITGRSNGSICNLTRRLVLDVLVHHSPQDVHLAVLADSREAVSRWEWLKWLPHTDSLGEEKKFYHLAFDAFQADKVIEFLVAELHDRRERSNNLLDGKKKPQPAFVVLIEDSDQIRQRADIPMLAEWGYEAGIHLIFVGGKDWPRECRSRIDILENNQFKFTETWTKTGGITTGNYEGATLANCEQVARGLAGLEVAGSGPRVPLPESVRVSQIIGPTCQSVEAVKQSWSEEIAIQDQLHFPIGVCAKRDHLELAEINLLPAEFGGNDAYHTILIGTTGSGKSEFMKSLVMGAAAAYPPNLLNFFFLDFKGGAAFGIFENLPHVSGVVNNLSPELVERGLDSIKNEIDRRQTEFAKSKVQRIWDYNNLRSESPMPHLVLFLDEFARGLADFPRLRETLDVLVRTGRSLGMYLILANQDANAEVDKLLNNVGWRIALKVGKSEELSIIDRKLPKATRAGQGYLRALNGEITEFQAGYGGFRIQNAESVDTEGFTIYQVEPDGGYKPFFKHISESAHKDKSSATPVVKEEEFIISILQQATTELRIKSAPRIYLDPLPEIIPLEEIFSEAGVASAFSNDIWQQESQAHRIIAYWGRQDIPRECLQEVLLTDFNDRDGHLWIVGAQGSGKDVALTSLLLSLAMTYTPEQLHYYLIDLGSGELAPLEGLPHTGAVIRPQNQEKERLVRLLKYLDEEMDRRTSRGIMQEEQVASLGPSIFIVINNFAELHKNFPDESDHLIRFFRDGKPAGIHLIVVTNRGLELPRSISNIIARRLVLQLGSRDEYPDLLGRQIRPSSENTSGRGYWMDGEPCECQVAKPPDHWRDLMRKMRAAWKGITPKTIEILPVCIPLSAFLEELDVSHPQKQIFIPVGRLYETLDLAAPSLSDSNPFWIIIGPKQSGKSNFLGCVGKASVENNPDDLLVKIYAFRRSPLVTLGLSESRIKVLNNPDEIQRDCQELSEALKSGKPMSDGKRLLLLMDDLGFIFQPGKEALMNTLNGLAQNLEGSTDVFILATGILDELRMQVTSSFLKLMRQGRTGIVLSKDFNELEWMGAQISMEDRRLEIPLGRGFYVNKGKPFLVQTPLLGECKQ